MDMRELLDTTRKVVPGDLGTPTVLPCSKCGGQIPFFSSAEVCPYCGCSLELKDSSELGVIDSV